MSTPITRRLVLAAAAGAAARTAFAAPPADWGQKLVAAARTQLGVTTIYDPSYIQIPYPGGDFARQRGVCTDVVVRAYRDAFGLDLQKLIHEDMTRSFAAYPTRWGLAAPNASIDHRRVPNMQVFFRRQRAEIPMSTESPAHREGDLVTVRLPGNLDHIMIVMAAAAGERPLIIHNIGDGAQLEDRLFEFPHTGHYRFAPPGP